MRRNVPSDRPSRALILLSSAGFVAVVAAVLGYTELADVVGGGVIIVVAFLSGRPVTRRLAIETDPGRELTWDLLLVLVIVVALVGVGVMAAAIPPSSP